MAAGRWVGWAWLALAGLCLAGMAYGAWQAYQASQRYEALAAEIAEVLGADRGPRVLGDRALETITFGLYQPYSEWLDRLRTLRGERQAAGRRAMLGALMFFACAVSLSAVLGLWRRSWRAVAQGLALACVPALLVGLFAPLLMIVAYRDLPLVGEMVFQYRSKGIVAAVEGLFASGQPLIGGTILLFSVLLPVAKTLALLSTFVARRRAWGARLIGLMHYLGRWSMADVFVAALLLTYFISEKGGLTHAEVQIGFYFFMGYVLLSLVASEILVHERTLDGAREGPRGPPRRPERPTTDA